MDIPEALSAIETALIGPRTPDAAALRAVRAMVDDPAFLKALKEYMRGINDPDVLAQLLTRLTRLMRHCSDKSDDTKLHSEVGVRAGLGTGVGLVAGSIIAAVSAPVPVITLITIVGGLWMTGTGYFY